MSRRNSRPGRRSTAAHVAYQDPFVVLSAGRAWRADDAVDNGSVTTSLPSYVGPALSLLTYGTGQAIKAPASELGSRLAITSDGNTATDGYGAVALAGAPSALTLASVVYCGSAAVAHGIANTTVGDVQLTGCDHSYSAGASGIRCRKSGGPTVDVAALAPRAFVLVTVFSATATTSYVNSLTPASVADATALTAATKLNVMCLMNGATVLLGKWATTGYWERALSASEAAFVLTRLGRRYGVVISA